MNRTIISIYGPDVIHFLQNIITNDINQLKSNKAIYALLLTPQGKYLYDFFLIKYDEFIYLECDKLYTQQIIDKLNILKTYLRVKLQSIDDLKIGVLLNTSSITCIQQDKKITQKETINSIIKSCNTLISFQDPRHLLLGTRIIHRNDIQAPIAEYSQYEQIRIQYVIPEGIKDMIQNESYPLQYLIDKIHGISFNKGCYIGQEVVQRMSRQEILRKKIYPIQANSILPNSGTKICSFANEIVGELRSSIDNIGLALLDTSKCDSHLYCGPVQIYLR
ncbi:CAF17-like 4Fe-4S cluster assembly/insertion protein YgfZ [Wolbachia endosymbiont of Howardula sp.]|uniref:CAF17-like 4Fe-4S cluster assembly/insertion protein YgfZ n=1 Tax=Wolbachia endosymbiont of Howardula sp. TaxID=2916816 RepID=UPI00217EE0B3|nr:folate-binding protein [Wolbachia endosymbiont of Howardula sp.]UWI82972.1 folate-binding protein [Wolbachia endosymbiont of Howardula sp.]